MNDDRTCASCATAAIGAVDARARRRPRTGELSLARVPAPADGKAIDIPLAYPYAREASGHCAGPVRSVFVADTAHDRIAVRRRACGERAWLPAGSEPSPRCPRALRVTARARGRGRSFLLVADPDTGRCSSSRFPDWKPNRRIEGGSGCAAERCASIRRQPVAGRRAHGPRLHRICRAAAPILHSPRGSARQTDLRSPFCRRSERARRLRARLRQRREPSVRVRRRRPLRPRSCRARTAGCRARWRRTATRSMSPTPQAVRSWCSTRRRFRDGGRLARAGDRAGSRRKRRPLRQAGPGREVLPLLPPSAAFVAKANSLPVHSMPARSRCGSAPGSMRRCRREGRADVEVALKAAPIHRIPPSGCACRRRTRCSRGAGRERALRLAAAAACHDFGARGAGGAGSCAAPPRRRTISTTCP